MINRMTHTIHLHDVLYIPGNQNNLFSLRRWITKGGNFMGHNLALISKSGNIIANRMLTLNNLIKLCFWYTKDDIHINTSLPALTSVASLLVIQQLKSWNVWHHRFGHIGFSSLCKLSDKQLVTGFTVDCTSQFSDCAACTEAKQSVILFNKGREHNTEPGELTHVDVWGKYSVTSINGYQYYLLMVDNASRYVTVEFLKSKDQAGQKVKNYFTHLQV